MTSINKKLYNRTACRLICLAFLSGLAVACANKEERQLSDLLAKSDFFRLKAQLAEVASLLPEDRYLYYAMNCEFVFGNAQLSNEYADRLLHAFGSKLADSVRVEIMAIKANNYAAGFQYAKAAEVCRTVVADCQHVLDSAQKAGYQNGYRMYAALQNVKPQIMHLHRGAQIPARRNSADNLEVPVDYKGFKDEFIFDSGANMSLISDSCATKMGMEIIESDITVGTSTDLSVQVKLAVADSLYVGDILFENVVFTVAPEAAMSFPEDSFYIHGVIGFPVFHQMGEIRMPKEGAIIVPETPTDRPLNNMFLMNGKFPVVQMLSGGDTLLLTFDTGARRSELSSGYYERHKAAVEQQSERQSHKSGGIGETVVVPVYKLRNFPFTIGSKSSILPEMLVMVEHIDFTKSIDGNLGQDIIMQFDTLVMNFKYMYVDFK